MNPTSHKRFYEKVANELGFPVEEVEYIVDNYWKTIRKIMENQEHYRINVDQIGDFIILRKKVKKKIAAYKKRLDYINMKEYKQFTRYAELESKISKLEGLFNQYESEAERRKEIKKCRK